MAADGSDALVSRARSGDEQAWRELYVQHSGRLTAWLHSLPTGDAATSPEDLTAEAWLTAARRIDDFVGSDDDFAGWLFTVARNLASNRRRTSHRRRTDPVAVEAGSDSTWGRVEDASGRVEGEALTRHLLAQLSPREAEVVACVDVAGLDVATTARALGISPVAVRVARHRALGRLRTLLPADV